MVEEQPANEKQIKVGDQEAESLKAKKVKIQTVEIEEVRKKADNKIIGKKVVCMCKHPDKEEAISISSMKYEKGGKLTESGIWFNLDDDGKIRKGSALALLLNYTDSTNLEKLEGKEIQTVKDDNGYLCLKTY